MNKFDLSFRSPLMNTAGMLGFTPDNHSGARSFQMEGVNGMGAFVTNPISLRRRVPTSEPEILQYPGGLLMHTGLPNPGLPAVLKKHVRRWATANLPVIVHLMADRPEETVRMVRTIEGLENIAAIEMGFAPQLSGDIILVTVELSAGELPMIINLPFEQVLSLGPRVIEAGAAAISFAPPRGSLPVSGTDGQVITGRLYGPSLFPQALDLLRSAVRLGLPVIAGVGVYSPEQAASMLACGALAVQLDTVLWT